MSAIPRKATVTILWIARSTRPVAPTISAQRAVERSRAVSLREWVIVIGLSLLSLPAVDAAKYANRKRLENLGMAPC